nr:cell envelope integrity protein TolA [Providencia stuartii]
GSGPYRGGNGDADFINITKERITQVFRTTNATTYQYPYGPTFLASAGDAWGSICIQHTSGNVIVGAGIAGQAGQKNTLYGTANTTKDANGNLKAASPIVKVFADHIGNNDESEGVTLKKLHTGIYQLHGVLGLHSDASWGGINGGITVPCGINQLPLVFVLYDVLEKGKPHPFDGRIVEPDEDGDIVLYTSYRKHDLPQNIQYERFKLYPEFLRDAEEDEESIPGFNGKVELTPGEPCDIPRGHWIDVRVNMPSNSIYNLKQAEAERLAKEAAEKQAEEDAKRSAEEAELESDI